MLGNHVYPADQRRWPLDLLNTADLAVGSVLATPGIAPRSTVELVLHNADPAVNNTLTLTVPDTLGADGINTIGPTATAPCTSTANNMILGTNGVNLAVNAGTAPAPAQWHCSDIAGRKVRSTALLASAA